MLLNLFVPCAAYYIKLHTNTLPLSLLCMDHTENAHCHWEREPINITYYSLRIYAVTQVGPMYRLKSEWKANECEWEKLPLAFDLIKINFNRRIRKNEFSLFRRSSTDSVDSASTTLFLLCLSANFRHFYFTVSQRLTLIALMSVCVCLCVSTLNCVYIALRIGLV